jgi:hypothetical protein
VVAPPDVPLQPRCSLAPPLLSFACFCLSVPATLPTAPQDLYGDGSVDYSYADPYVCPLPTSFLTSQRSAAPGKGPPLVRDIEGDIAGWDPASAKPGEVYILRGSKPPVELLEPGVPSMPPSQDSVDHEFVAALKSAQGLATGGDNGVPSALTTAEQATPVKGLGTKPVPKADAADLPVALASSDD